MPSGQGVCHSAPINLHIGTELGTLVLLKQFVPPVIRFHHSKLPRHCLPHSEKFLISKSLQHLHLTRAWASDAESTQFIEDVCLNSRQLSRNTGKGSI